MNKGGYSKILSAKKKKQVRDAEDDTEDGDIDNDSIIGYEYLLNMSIRSLTMFVIKIQKPIALVISVTDCCACRNSSMFQGTVQKTYVPSCSKGRPFMFASSASLNVAVPHFFLSFIPLLTGSRD